MKRFAAFLISIMLCFAFCLTAFADNIYIVDDKEDEFVPDVQVTTTVPETTTAASSGDSILGDMGSLEDLFGDFKDTVSGGIDSILGEFGDTFGNLDFNFGTEATTTADTQLPTMNNQDAPTQSNQAQQLVDSLPEATTAKTEATTAGGQMQQEIASVIIVNNGSSDKDGLSGSTLTLIVFIGAIVLLILVAAVALVIMTRRTEYNSSVLDKSTIPSVEKPNGMAHLMNDNIRDDGNDYGNITYWNE